MTHRMTPATALCDISPVARWALPLALALLSGCAGGLLVNGEPEFACKAQRAGGVSCMSAREIYSATEQTSVVVPKRTAPLSTLETGPSAGRSPTMTGLVGDTVDRNAAAMLAPPMLTPDRPIPIRSQAKVMRIWFAPWEDATGDLNAIGLAFTEIETRRWNLGEKLVTKAPLITPLQVIAPSTARSATTPSDAARQALGVSAGDTPQTRTGASGLPR